MLFNNLPSRPVSAPKVDGWKTTPINDCGEPLVAMGAFSDYPFLLTDAIYSGQRGSSPYLTTDLDGALITMFARRSVAEALMAAQSLLPAGLILVINDAYRPRAVQASLYQSFYRQLKAKQPTWDNDQLASESQKYVSLPSTNEASPAPHYTGGAIDLSLAKLPRRHWHKLLKLRRAIVRCHPSQWQLRYRLEMDYQVLSARATSLNFGAAFDHGGPASAAMYYEILAATRALTAPENSARTNRRMLAAAMHKAGFSAYEHEWWHYNLGNQMDARGVGAAFARYGGIELSSENHRHNAMRRQHWTNVLRLASGERWSPPTSLAEHYAVVLSRLADLRKTNLTPAERIEASMNMS
ncbi:hypothetical protein HJC99_04235 [Candidatus Saccharibacteria bacterium]|nr:hypothetical protein [Candidatus Saccharibacteria bacterium]